MVKPTTGISGKKSAFLCFCLLIVLLAHMIELQSLKNYLKDVWGIKLTHAAGIINIWNGLSKMLPVFFLFLVDAFLGHFMMLVISSVAYSVGISFVVMSTIPRLGRLGRCNKYKEECIVDAQKVIFYVGMALIATGRAGYAVSVRHFRKEQSELKNKSGKHMEQPGNADANTSNNSGKRKEQAQNADKNTSTANCLKSILLVLLVLIAIVGALQLVYIKGNTWSIIFGIPAICTLFATFLFFSGWRTYQKVGPKGSPVTNVCRVFVAFFLKRSKEHPGINATSLYRKDNKESFTPTRFLRRLEKAAIILSGDIGPNGQVNNKWKLCSVSEVEEAKVMVRMVPMWLTFIVCGIVSSNGNTYFMEQANHMNRNIGKWKVPLLVLVLLFKCVKRTLGRMVNKYFLGKPSGENNKVSRFPAYLNDEKFRPALGIGIAMVFSVLCCITDARIESKRLNLLDKDDGPIQMSVYWLLFQFFLLSGLDAFSKNSIAAFYADQGPKSMEHYLRHFGKFVFGLGFMFSVLSIDVVGKIRKRLGKRNWFQSTLNESHLDSYYLFLTGLSSVNLVVYTVVACCYRFKNTVEGQNIEKDPEGVDADTGGAGKEPRLRNDHKKANVGTEVGDSNAGRPH